MDAGRKRIVADAMTLGLGVGLVYWAVYFILTADTHILWLLVWQLPLGIVAVGAGLLLYGEAVWRFAQRDRRAAAGTSLPKEDALKRQDRERLGEQALTTGFA